MRTSGMRTTTDGPAAAHTRAPARPGPSRSHDVRFAFQIQRSLLREVKQLALDLDTTTSDLVRAWIATAIEGGFDNLPPPHVSKAGRMSQFPVNLTVETRAALRTMSADEDLSCAQLMRRLIVQGLSRARCSEAASALDRRG